MGDTSKRQSAATVLGLVGAIAVLIGASGCLSSSNGAPSSGNLPEGSFDAAPPPPMSTDGSVSVDGGPPEAGSPEAGSPPEGGSPEAGSPDAGVTKAGAHQGFGLVSGGVRASSAGHVIVTTTGQAPGGNATMHSTGHSLVGGVVGGTQKQ